MEYPSFLIQLAVLAASAFFYSIILTIYRLYFHPLSKFPGPKLAAATMWYEFYYDIVHDGQFMWAIEKMHEKYGPIVRINPHELHIRDATYYDTLYSSYKNLDKYAWWTLSGGTPLSAFATVSHDLHRLRRSALNPFFAKRSIQGIQPLIQSRVERLSSRLEAASKTGEVLRADAACMALTMDIITTYIFGKCFDHLDRPDFNLAWKDAIMASFATCSLLRQIPSILSTMKAMPDNLVKSLSPSMGLLIDWQNTVRTLARVAMEDIKNKHDDGGETTVFDELLQSDLPPPEKTLDRLADEGQILAGAGSETTAKALATTFFYLLRDKAILQKLRDELKTVSPGPWTTASWTQLEQLPYLSAVISEGLRLSYGVTTRLPRISHTEVLKYDKWEIPIGTPVSETPYFVLMDPTIFPSPESFRPERWLEPAPNGDRLDKYMVVFNKGSRICLGINLAYAELYLTIGTIIRRFDMELFETDLIDVVVKRDHFVPSPDASSRGVRVRVLGIAE